MDNQKKNLYVYTHKDSQKKTLSNHPVLEMDNSVYLVCEVLLVDPDQEIYVGYEGNSIMDVSLEKNEFFSNNYVITSWAVV